MKIQAIAEDILQETFLKMHKNIMRYDPQQKAMPWVFTIARHTLIDHIRKSRDIHLDDMDIFTREDEPLNLDDEIEFILQSLSPEERELITDRFLADKSFEQIALDKQSSPAAIRKRVSRLMAKVRLKLGSTKEF